MTMPTTAAPSMESLFKRVTKIRQKQLSYLTAEQANTRGFKLDKDWAVKIDYGTDGGEPKYTYVSPEKWEFSGFTYGDKGDVLDYSALSPEGKTFTKAELDVLSATPPIPTEPTIPAPLPMTSDETGIFAPAPPTDTASLLRRIYPEKFKLSATEEAGLTAPLSPDAVLQQTIKFAETDTEGFLKDLVNRGDTPDTRALLRSFQVPEVSIDEVFVGAPAVSQFGQSLMKALPLTVRPNTVDWAVQYFGNNPDKLRRELITAGRNAETEALVKTQYPAITERGLQDYFNVRVPGTVEGVAPEALGVLPTLTWLDKVKEMRTNPAKLVPFVSSGVEIVELGKLLKTAKDLEDGKEVSKEDLLALKAYVDRATMDTTWGYEVADVLAQLLPFAGEFIATGGIFSVGKTAIVKAGTAALKRIATKTGLRILEGKLAKYGVEAAGIVVGGTLRTIPAGITRIPAGTLEKQLQATLTGDEESVWESLAKATGEQWVEVVSESTGGLFAPLTAPIKGRLVKLGIFNAFLKANPGKSAKDINKILGKMGYNGVIGEMLEERVADVMHGVLEPLGLSDQKFSIPSLKQLSVELVSFSVPGVAAKVAESMPLEKIGKMAKAVAVAPFLGTIPSEGGKPEVPPVTPKVISKFAPEYVAFLKTIEGKSPTDFVIKKEVGPVGPIYRVYDKVTNEQITGQPSLAKAKSELDRLLQQAVAIPKTEALPAQTWTEAGLQPSMLPEEVAAKEVRPVGKGEIVQANMEDYLKLEKAKRIAAAEEVEISNQKAYEAQVELEVTQEWLQSEPASKLTNLIRKSGWFKGEIKNLTKEQYREISGKEPKASILGTETQIVTVKAHTTKDGKYIPERKQKVTREIVRWEYALDDIATEMGYADGDALKVAIEQAREGQLRIEELKGQIISEVNKEPLKLLPELTPEEVTEQFQMMGQPRYNLKQIEALVAPFAEYVMNPNTLTAYELARQTLSLQRSERFNNLKARLQEIQVQTGEVTEEKARQVIKDTLSGEYWVEMTDYLQFITGELRDAHFAKVAYVLKDYPAEYAGTITALVNALSGRPIPNVRPTPPPGGFTSRLWPQGASALDKLQYVFGKGTRHMKALEKMAEEKKPLDDVVKGVFKEVVEGGRPPIPIDQATADYLRGLENIPFGYKILMEEPWRAPPPLPPDTRTPLQKSTDLQNFKLELAPDVWKDWSPERLELLSYLRVNLLKKEYQAKLIEEKWMSPPSVSDTRTTAQRALDLVLFKIEMAKPPVPVTPFEAPIEDAFKIKPMFNFMEQRTIVRVLKELAWLPIDIGNFLRATKTTLDNSFLRQAKVLNSGHPFIAYEAYKTSWATMFHQKSAEAEWQLITRDPEFEMYEQIRQTTGADPLRMPSFAAQKGTAQWRTAEEYGFPTVERLIPRVTAKLPHIRPFERAFVSGTNKVVWRNWKNQLRVLRREAEKVASGEIKLPEGKAVDIVGEMSDFQGFLADAIQRASLRAGKINLEGFAPVLNATLFAARSKLGRFLFPRHLLGITFKEGKVGFNPRIMKEAWKDFLLMNAFWGGLMFLGDWLGLWVTEDDPRNTEFGSARIGKIRIDPWAGFRQFFVLYARLSTGTGVSSVTGAEYDIDKLGTLQNFIRGSLAPATAILLDFWTGRNFLGEVVEVTNAKEWLKAVLPMSLVDMWEAYELEGKQGLAISVIPAFHGEGVQTYTGDWDENFRKLGLPKYLENTAYGITEPPYDAGDFWTDHASEFKGVDPETLTEKKGYDPYVRAWAEAYQVMEITDHLPNEKLISINADPMKGGVKTPTFVDYYKMWHDRQKLVLAGDKAEWTDSELQPDGKYKTVTYKGEDALVAFDKKEGQKPAQSRLGNISQTQFALLNEYWSITDKKKQADFLKAHPELEQNSFDEWYKSHPKENAILAMHGVEGHKTLFSEKAYDLAIQMAKEWDYPESAIEPYLPPKDLAKTHFDRIDTVDKWGANSWEDKLLRTTPEGKKWVEWYNKNNPDKTLSEIDTPIASLELKVKNHINLDLLDSSSKTGYGNPDSPNYIADEKKRKEAVAKLYTDNPDLHDDQRRIEAIEKLGEPSETALNKIKDFLKRTDIETKQYIEGKYVCTDFTEDLLVEAEKAGLPIGLAQVHFSKRDMTTKGVTGFTQTIWEQYLATYPEKAKQISGTRLYVTRPAYEPTFIQFLENNPDIAKQIKWQNNDDFQVSTQITSHQLGYVDIGEVRYFLEPQNDKLMTEPELKEYWKSMGFGDFLGLLTQPPRYKPEVTLTEMVSIVNQILIDKHVAYMQIEDIGGKGVEAKTSLFRVDNPEYDKWRTDIPRGKNLHLEPIDQTRIPIWRIDVKYATQDAEYKTILDANKGSEESQAIKAYLAGEGLTGEALTNRVAYRQDRRRRTAYGLTNSKTGEAFPRDQVENYVAYYEIPTIKESKRPERFVVDNPTFAEAMYRITGKDIWLTKPEEVPNIAYDDLYDKYKDLFDEMRDNSDRDSKYYIKDQTTRTARDKQIFDENPAFKEAFYLREGYALHDKTYNRLSETDVRNYATYMLIPPKGYADSRFMKTHKEFYFAIRKIKGWTDDVPEWDKIPTEAVENLYNQYESLPKGKRREDFRANNPDLDKWLVSVGKVIKSITETYRIRELTPKEKFEEAATAADIEFDKRMEELRKRLEKLKK